MNRETKRPRITRPIENRDENRRGRTPRFENREGGESETRRPNRFNTDRPRREQGYGYIRDLNKERERERNEGTGERDNGIQTETMKEGIGRIIVTRIGITEDRTREVTGITIVFPIVENVVKGGLKIGMKM